MKEGWEIRKLGDVCTTITDGSHNPPKGIAHSDFAMISSQNVYNDKISFDDVRYLQEEDFKNEDKRTSVRKGDVLLTIVGTVGRCAVFSVDRRITLQRSVAVLRPQNCLKPRFLMHCLISKSAWLNEEAHGIAQKGLYLKQLAKVSIPVPPIAEQEKIVAELDCLTGIIEKKKKQLEELDKLAQSVFNDMFGDPITNEKGWPVKRLGEIGKVITGNTPTTRDAENYSSNDYCFVKPGDIGKDAVETIEKTEAHISTKAYMSSRRLPIGSVLTTCIGIVGKVGITGKEATCNQQINAILPNDGMSSIYVATAILLCRKVLEVMANAPVVPIINKGDFSSISIPFPPLDLQNEFAQKIEAIKKQKELVKRSIVETEMLFNSRMDYWFN